MATRPAPQDRLAAQAERAAQDAEACRLSATGYTYEQIAERLGLPNRQAAYRAVKRVLDRRIKDGNVAVEQLRAKQDALLDEALKVATQIMHAQHLAVGNGRVVQKYNAETDTHEDVYDSAPNLAAADRLIKISESRRKLHGWDAPAKQEISGTTTVAYQVSVAPDEMEQL